MYLLTFYGIGQSSTLTWTSISGNYHVLPSLVSEPVQCSGSHLFKSVDLLTRASLLWPLMWHMRSNVRGSILITGRYGDGDAMQMPLFENQWTNDSFTEGENSQDIGWIRFNQPVHSVLKTHMFHHGMIILDGHRLHTTDLFNNSCCN